MNAATNQSPALTNRLGHLSWVGHEQCFRYHKDLHKNLFLGPKVTDEIVQDNRLIFGGHRCHVLLFTHPIWHIAPSLFISFLLHHNL